MSYSESEPDSNSLSIFVSIFSKSESKSDYESDFNSVFMNLDIRFFLSIVKTESIVMQAMQV